MILLDNAKWHTSPLMRHRLAKMGLPVIFSGPYSYSTAPVELVFSALKRGDLNPEQDPSGKSKCFISYYLSLLTNYLCARRGALLRRRHGGPEAEGGAPLVGREVLAPRRAQPLRVPVLRAAVSEGLLLVWLLSLI